MKIIQFVRGSERYGAAVSIKNLCSELNRRNHEVVLMLAQGQSLGVDASLFRTIEVEPYHKFDPRGISRVRSILASEKPDLVHTHLSAATFSGSVAARLAKVPVISTVHGMNRRWTYSFANRLITVSDAGKRNLVDQGIPSSRISVAYNGIEIPKLPSAEERAAAKKELGFEEDHVVFGALSRADYNKGVQDAIAALAIIRRRAPAARFVYAGEGEYLENLRQQARVLGLESQVRFLGFRSEVNEVLAGIDAFICPSLREAMGIAIVEAMAMGKPVVGTNVGGIPEVVDDGSGILVPPNDPPSLAGACLRLVNDRNELDAMGRNARRRVSEHFSLAASADAVETAYSHLLGTQGRRAATVPM